MQCTRCAIDYPEDKQLCTVCGESLSPSDATTPFPRCSNCGAAVALNDRFCPGCGAGRGEASTGAPPVGGPPAAPSGDSDEDLLALQHFKAKHRHELRRSITLGVATGLLLTLVLVLGVNAYRSRRASELGIPVPSAAPRLPSGKGASQVATADEVGIKISGIGAADPERSEAEIRRTVEQHLGELQQEYLTALQTDPAAEGVVTLHMTLAADGSVAYARSTALGLADHGMLASVERQASAWRFAPSPAGLTSVHYPLVFYLPKTDPRQLVARLQSPSAPAVGPD